MKIIFISHSDQYEVDDEFDLVDPMFRQMHQMVVVSIVQHREGDALDHSRESNQHSTISLLSHATTNE